MEQIRSSKIAESSTPFSQAIKEGNRVYVSGQVGFDREGSLVGDDFDSQLTQTLANVSYILDEAGSSLDKVIKTTAYLTDANNFESFNKLYGEIMPQPYPARTTVITDLALDELLVEIDVIAKI